MEIGAWLRALGLERYEQAFRDNEIDADLLPNLTGDDLKDLGVSLVGHRRRMLDAIAALRAPEPEDVEQHGDEAPQPALARRTEAERRQLTVLFCDLVGSTALAARLDPEDLRDVIRAYQKACADVIGRFEGHLARCLGDGVLAYFGWPRAHEDDAERGVRAGLQLVRDVARLEPRADVQLQARAGVATGQVVVGDLISEGVSDKDAVSGSTPNMAARLQALATPGSVVISQATRRLVGGLFELDDLGPQRLKGFAEPLAAWRVAGEGRAEGRFEARESAGLTPLVGREEELALLVRLWRQASEGAGHVVLLSGEAGIGKSRIVRELRERIAAEPHIRLIHQCSSYHQTSPLHPIIEHLERAAGFARDDPPEARLAKLETLLARGTDRLESAVPLIAALLAVPTGERSAPLDLTPQRQKQLTLEVLLDQLEGLAAEQPVLAVHEDVHWMDPTTQELLGLMIELIPHRPVLMILTFRPEFTPPWPAQPYVSALALTRFGRREGAAMVDRMVGDKALPDEVAAQIVAKTDGVPLFVEELTKTVLESDLLRDAGNRYELSGRMPPLAIPATLHDSLMARLDRLAPAKAVAQVAAAIGREFSHELLAAVAAIGEHELAGALAQLIDADLVFRRGLPPRAGYSFKHALVQDAAYASLLRSERRRLHACIAEVLEERFPETAETGPEILAHHCAQAGLAEKAIAYRFRAGQRAIARSALAEAVAQLNQGLELLAGLPDGPDRWRRELDFQVTLGAVLVAARGYAAEETGWAFARARELCREERDVHRLLPVLNGQALFHLQRAEPHAAHAIAAEMLEVARRWGDAALLIPAHRALSMGALYLGRFAVAREHAEEVLALYHPARHRALASLYTFDQRVVALGYLAAALFALGYPEQARRRSHEAVAEAQKLAHPNTLAQAQFRACVFCYQARDTERLQDLAAALIAVATEHGLAFFLAVGRCAWAWVLIQKGRAEEGLAETEQAMAAIRAIGDRLSLTYARRQLAEAYAAARGLREAPRWVLEMLTSTDSGGDLGFEAEQHRRKGQVLLSLPEPDHAEAEACFRRAIEVARQQGAKMWELEAATTLARLWHEQGRQAEAHDLLAPVYGWFTEGFDTADLNDAKALLDELR